MVGYSPVTIKAGILWTVSYLMMGLLQAGELPISIIPTLNLAAIIVGSIAMGMLLNRVRQLEKDREGRESLRILVEELRAKVDTNNIVLGHAEARILELERKRGK